jgi:hypothetical protein
MLVLALGVGTSILCFFELMTSFTKTLLLTSVLLGGGALASLNAEDVYLAPADFIAESFENPPEEKVLWFTADTKAGIRRVLGENYPGLRLRYWQDRNRTAWILEKIGKVKPITTGFLVEDGVLLQMRVLIYRESHGWEVRYPFFTKQFRGLQLNSKDQLNQNIDGISGATLSVNALTRLAKLALFLHSEVSP